MLSEVIPESKSFENPTENIPIPNDHVEPSSQQSPPTPPKEDESEVIQGHENDMDTDVHMNGTSPKTEPSEVKHPKKVSRRIEIPPNGIGGLTKDQARFCLAIIRSLKKRRDADPFLYPVDPVALKIPDYPTIIKNPMDISTVERKLNEGLYSSPNQFISDVQLIWDNCYLYNGRDAPISLMAQTLEKTFNTQIKNMPTEKEKQPSRKQNDTRQKRESMSSNVEAALAKKRNRIANDPQMKFCHTVLKELYKKQHQSYAFPFYEPVDWVALKIPDYPEIIKQPMDLSTVKKKLENHQYETAKQFEDDVRLMFRNCYKYNPPKNPVYAMGKALERVFNNKWTELPAPASAKPDYESDEESDEDVDRHAQELEELEKHLQAVRDKLQSMKSPKHKKEKPKNKTKQPSRSSLSPKASNKASRNHKGSKGVKRKSQEDDTFVEASFDKKMELSHKINELHPDKLDALAAIIYESKPQLKDAASNDLEIELDIDSLDAPTFSKLYKFVIENTVKKKPQQKRSKVISEEEQSRRISELEAKLKKFDEINKKHPGTHIKSSDDEGSDDSASESDNSKGDSDFNRLSDSSPDISDPSTFSLRQRSDYVPSIAKSLDSKAQSISYDMVDIPTMPVVPSVSNKEDIKSSKKPSQSSKPQPAKPKTTASVDLLSSLLAEQEIREKQVIEEKKRKHQEHIAKLENLRQNELAKCEEMQALERSLQELRKEEREKRLAESKKEGLNLCLQASLMAKFEKEILKDSEVPEVERIRLIRSILLNQPDSTSPISVSSPPLTPAHVIVPNNEDQEEGQLMD